MIRYALICADCEAEFEAWFASSDSYAAQAEADALECPECASKRVGKQIMAPAVRTSKPSSPVERPVPAKMLKAARDYIAQTHDYAGKDFPAEARAMHYGEVEERPIWGEATSKEAVALKEEGIGAMPLPAPLVPKCPKDKSKLN